MASLPILFLLLAAILLWLMRRSHIRLLWMVALTGVLGAWLSSLILTYALPSQVYFLRGQTASSSALLRLDLISWPFVLVLATLYLALLLSTFAKRDDFAWKPVFQFMLVGAAGLAAVMAGNVLSFVLTWSLLDLTTLAIRTNNAQVEDERLQAIQIFASRITASVLIMTAEFMNRSLAGSKDLADVRAIAVFGLLFIALLLRSGKIGRRLQSRELPAATLSIHSILSTTVGFSLVARVLTSSLHPSILDEIRFAGAIFAAWAIAALWLNAHLHLNRINLGLVFLGVVLSMEANSSHASGQFAVSIGVLLIISAGASQIRKTNRTWHMLISGILALMFVGMPGSFGNVLMELATSIIQDNSQLGLWMLAPLVLVVFAARMIMESLGNARQSKFPATEPSIRAVIAMLLLPLLGFATLLVDRQETVVGGPLFVAMAGAVLLSVVALQRFKIYPIANLHFAMLSDSLRPVLRNISNPIRQIINASADLFEGETGMLWVYVIMLFLFVAFGILG